MVPRFLEGYGTPGIRAQGSRGVLPGARQVARPLVGERRGYAVRGASWRQRSRSSRPLSSWPNVAEAQVVEEIGIVGVLAEKLLKVDAVLVEQAGGEELVGAGEVIGHCERR